jgi:hypothetical protein
MKRTSLLFGLATACAVALGSVTSAFAGYVSVRVGQSAYLPSCGGTIAVNNGGNDDQLNLVFSRVAQCSYYIDYLGRQYRLQGQQPNYFGSFTATTAHQSQPGWHVSRFTLRSNSGAHSDTIDVSYYVTGTPNPPGSGILWELATQGTVHGTPVLGWLIGNSGNEVSRRADATCRAAGARYAQSYALRQASYNGQLFLRVESGSWQYDTVRNYRNVQFFRTLVCR